MERWHRWTRHFMWETRRNNDFQLLLETSLPKPMEKLPPPMGKQSGCPHPERQLRGQSNQWASTLKCSKCDLRLSYVPTALALEATAMRGDRRKRRDSVRKGPTSRVQARAMLQKGEVKSDCKGEAASSNSEMKQLLQATVHQGSQTQQMMDMMMRQTRQSMQTHQLLTQMAEHQAQQAMTRGSSESMETGATQWHRIDADSARDS